MRSYHGEICEKAAYQNRSSVPVCDDYPESLSHILRLTVRPRAGGVRGSTNDACGVRFYRGQGGFIACQRGVEGCAEVLHQFDPSVKNLSDTTDPDDQPVRL